MYAALVLLVVVLQNISRSTTTTTHIVENKYKFISKACDFFKVPRFAFISSSSLPPPHTWRARSVVCLQRWLHCITSAAETISSSFNSTQHSVHSVHSALFVWWGNSSRFRINIKLVFNELRGKLSFFALCLRWQQRQQEFCVWWGVFSGFSFFLLFLCAQKATEWEEVKL